MEVYPASTSYVDTTGFTTLVSLFCCQGVALMRSKIIIVRVSTVLSHIHSLSNITRHYVCCPYIYYTECLASLRSVDTH